MQPRFWPDPQPLTDRFGREFFRQVPTTPGVYLMHDAEDRVLYVGKARNLQRRLGSYRIANPDRLPRRIVRMLHLVRRIAWEEVRSETDALARESELLLSLRPRFNRAGVWKGPTRFLGWRQTDEGMALAVLDEAKAPWQCAGPFGAEARYVHAAMVRLLWCQFHPEAGLCGMPAGWFEGAFGPEVCIPQCNPSAVAEAGERLCDLASTRHDSFQDWLSPPAHPFEAPCREADLELVIERLVTRLVPRAVA
ncbi:MAG: nucleotide excision repair endonuclease [Verrucomicrobiae bacterium]|nr:nucleotide excision repair endonuclease [Verrucomicrobiae bacterium]